LSRRIAKGNPYSPSEGEERQNSPKGTEYSLKLRRGSTVCVRRLCRSAGAKESCEDLKSRSSGRIAVSYTQARPKSRGSQGRKEAKVEVFGSVKFFQVWEEISDAQEGATGAVGSGG
jgi:hypothetical protein